MRLQLASLAFAFLTTTVVADFNTIAVDGVAIINDLNTITAKLQAFGSNGNPSLTQALDVYNTTNTLNADLQKLTKDTNATPSLDAGQGNFLATTVANLQTNIYNVLDLLTAKKTAFEHVGGNVNVDSLVHDSLTQLKNSVDSFSKALTPKLAPELAKVAPLLTADIDYHFIRAIQAFAGSS